MKTALIELHFLPSLEYFCALLPYDRVVFESHEHFVKQSYRNRCYILTAQGMEMLTVPLTDKHGKVLIRDIRIDYGKKWQHTFWRTLESAYRKAPFFEHYEGALRAILYKRFEFLLDLNKELLSFCLQTLSWGLSWSESLAYEKTPGAGLEDLRSVIIAKKPFQERSFYTSLPYHQVFGKAFVPNLSIVDLLFCTGPDAKSLLWRSAGMPNK